MTYTTPKKKVGRPKGPSRGTVLEFESILRDFAEGKMSYGVVWNYMKRKGWLNDNAPEMPLIGFVIKKEPRP